MNTTLIVGIVAAVCTVVSWFGVPFVGFVGIICGIVAWVMGSKACKENPNDSQAKAGKILGMIVTILAIVSTVIILVIAGGVIGGVAVLALS